MDTQLLELHFPIFHGTRTVPSIYWSLTESLNTY